MTFEVGKGYKDTDNNTWHILFKTTINGKTILSLECRMPVMYGIGIVEGYAHTRATVQTPYGSTTIYGLTFLNDDLEPCPFCGGQARIDQTVNGGTRKLYCIECTKCYAKSPASLDSPQDSINAWNKRVKE